MTATDVKHGRNGEWTIWRLTEPLLLCMRAYGIYVQEAKLSHLQLAHAVHSFVVAMAMLACIVWTFVSTMKTASWEMTYMVLQIANVLMHLVAYVALVWQRRSLYRALLLLDHIRVHSLSDFDKRFRVMRLLIVASIALSLSIVAYSVATQPDLHCIYDGSKCPSVGDPRLFEMVHLAHFCLSQLISTAAYLTFTVVCLVLYMSIGCIDTVHRAHRASVAAQPNFVAHALSSSSSSSKSLSSSSPLSAVEFHHRICQGVAAYNAVFQQYLFVNSACELTAILFIARNMNLHLPNATVDAGNAFGFLRLFVLYATKNVCAGYLNSKVQTSMKLLYETCEYNDKGTNNSAKNLKIKLYVRDILMNPPAISGWSLYTPARSTVFTAATNILTYVLVLYHLTEAPPEDEHIGWHNKSHMAWTNASITDPFQSSSYGTTMSLSTDN